MSDTGRYLNQMAAEIHMINVDKGFWPEEAKRDVGTIIALIHSEASEALEEYRAGHALNETYYGVPSEIIVDGLLIKKPEGVPSELADVIIRTLDACAAWGIDIDSIVAEKIQYNRLRAYRHGGKLA